MRKAKSAVLILIIFFSFNCATKGVLSKLEYELLESHLVQFQSVVESYTREPGHDLDLYEHAFFLQNSISALAYAVFLDTTGLVLAHSGPYVLGEKREKYDDEATRKALEMRDPEPLVQELKFKDGREVIDFSLPVFDSLKGDPDSPVCKGIVKLGIYKDRNE